MSDSAPLHILITGGEGDLARALRANFEQSGHQVHAPGRKEMDVCKEEAVEDYFARMERVDVLITNAGLTRDGAVTGLSAEHFTEVVATNLRGTFFCVRAAIKLMVKQRNGHILMIGSRSGRHGNRGQSAYAAAKAGLCGLSQSVAKEYGGRNVRCNVVLPGFLETKMTAGLTPEWLAKVKEEHTLKRFNTVESSARAIAFLAGLEHVSGQVFTLDSRIDKWT